MQNSNIKQIVKELQADFIKEAKASPVLLQDMAHMEKYISESYDGRSLIELLQNADDVGATDFYIEYVDDNTFLVANNGRRFNSNDIWSLCRSGASIKRRHGDTIGYRGIGFKSVINYSDLVHVISGDLQITFSRDKTRQCLDLPDVDVPLIRIPHDLEFTKYKEQVNRLIGDGYTTVFVFETSNSKMKDEINAFDPACMLFLRAVSRVSFKIDETRTYEVHRVNQDDNILVTLFAQQDTTKWIVFSDNFVNAFAFKLVNEKIEILPYNDCCIHSFMPTREIFILPCRVNGDFSTDPSRNRIIIDEETIHTIDSLVSLLVKKILNILKDGKDSFELIKMLSDINLKLAQFSTKQTVNSVFLENFKKALKNQLADYYCTAKLYTKPDWMPSEDLYYFQNDDFHIVAENNDDNGSWRKLLNQIGVCDIPLNYMLSVAGTRTCNEKTRLNLIKLAAEFSRFDMSSIQKELVSNALLFQCKNEVKRIKDIADGKEISEGYIKKICNILSEFTLSAFLRRFGLKIKSTEIHQDNARTEVYRGTVSMAYQSVNMEPSIEKWRTAEVNARLLMEGMPGVKKVVDVSMQNLGYDLNVLYENNKQLFYEVKSVERLGAQISMTQNEYLTAIKDPEHYRLLVMCQDNEKIEAYIISNVAQNLDFEKRVRVYDWVCNKYNGEKIIRKFNS